MNLPDDLVPSDTPSANSGGTAHILPRERSLATFDVNKMTEVLYDGPDRVKKRKFILMPAGKTVQGPEKYELSREELMKLSIEDFIGIHKDFVQEGYRPERDEVGWMAEAATLTGPIMPHMSLAVSTIIGQASPAQAMFWLPKCLMFQAIFCYSQTELGIGSNHKNLRTTAVYDRDKECFILNTPTLASMKWWNSNIGCVATHACVYAQLIIDEKNYGLHVFVVQVRDENHQVLPGVEAGDVGTKVGDNAIDTGYLRLHNVSVPREHLLAKRQHVERDGTYVSHGKIRQEGGKAQEMSKRASYLTMVQARASMASIAAGRLSRAVVIAVRYSAVRHQGAVSSGSVTKEVQVLDYQVQRYRLFKHLAISYCIRASGNWMNKAIVTLSDVVNTMDEDISEANEKLFEQMPEIHATSSGLKGVTTLLAAEGIEDLRKATGGHGFLANAAIGPLHNDYVWHATAEGDFIVLLLQTARYLINSRRDALNGKQLSGLVDCFNPISRPDFKLESVKPKEPTTISQVKDPRFVLEMFRNRTLAKTMHVGRKFDEKVSRGVVFEDAWNDCSVRLVTAARAHVYYFMARNWLDTIREVKDENVVPVLYDLFALFGLQDMMDSGSWSGILSTGLYDLVESAVESILDSLRPNAVALVDAFDWSDDILNSTLGRSDGNVYEALYDAARKSALNKSVPFKGYHDVLEPHLDKEFLSLRGRVPDELKESRESADDEGGSQPVARL